MKKLKKPTTAILMATLIFSNMQLCPIYGDKVQNIGENRSKQIVEKNYKNTNKEESAYIKNYVSKSKDANTIVSIPDANLKKGIYETLGKQDNETITKGELESITYLEMGSSKITNLEGIQYCINLKGLSLDYNNIRDISALSGLINLESLTLSNNNIKDISVLSNMGSLVYLDLRSNNIRDISALSGLINLEVLELNNNNIKDISALSNMINLYYLDLSSNEISDIRDLSGLINLECLVLSNNNIRDISSLSNMSKLEYLDLNNNDISDIKPLSDLKIYLTLDLSNNKISDISPLSNMSSLGALYLDNNKISDINGLPTGGFLGTLSLSNNKISDISPLLKRDGLSRLNLENNNIEDIRALSNLEYLWELNLKNNNISDISPLSKLENLTTLNLSNNNISDIETLSNLNYKSHLDIRYIDLTVNHIDINNSKNMEVISHLEKLGYEVYYNGLNQSDAPVIIAEDKIIMIGDKFEELNGIVAKDKDGIDITDKIKVIENEVYTFDGVANAVGVYKVIYKVTDSQGISTTKEIRVTVTKKIDGIDLGEGNGTESNPLEVLLQDEKAIDELVSKLESSFEYNIVGEPVIKGDYKIYKIKLNDKTVAASEYVKNNENTSYIEIKVNINNTNLIDKLDKIFIKDNDDSNDGGIISPIPPQEEIKFNDVKGHWAEGTIETFIKKGYINGYEDNTFKPDNSMTRAEFVKVVNKVFGYTQKGEEQFTDVNENDWFYNDICIGIKAGYIKGKSTDIFAPNDNITRQEVAMILTNIMNNKDENLDKLNTFKDGDKTAEWAQSSVEGAIEAGYINGYEDKTIRPNGNITRAEAISMLSRVKK